MPPKLKTEYRGPVIFSYGFRPFFLLAGLFGLFVIPLWMAVYYGHVTLAAPFSARLWHIHEMLFGYSAAVIAGFLFTAVPNWTGRMPVRGWPLAVLTLIWLLGRLATAGLTGFSAPVVMVLDVAFLAAIVLMISREILAGKNWRNLKVLLPVTLLFIANVAFHSEALMTGEAPYSTRLGFASVIFLITLIGGRIIPSFTRNWLVKQGPGPLPVPFARYDAISIAVAAIALVGWIIRPEALLVGLLLTIAAALHLFRLSRWQGMRTLPSPLLLMLHVAYFFLPAGLLLLGLAGLAGLDSYVGGLHLLGIGAIGGTTVAVMMRAPLGHTGRALEAPKELTLAFFLIILASLLRSLAPDFGIAGYSGIELAAILWTLGFAVFVLRVGRWLVTPRQQPRKPNPRR